MSQRAFSLCVVLAAVAMLVAVGLLSGSPQGWMAVAGIVIAPFALRLADRPPVFVGIVVGFTTYVAWIAGTAPMTCSLSIEFEPVHVASTTCPRLLLPDLDHFPRVWDWFTTYTGGFAIAILLGGISAVIVDRSTRGRREPVAPPPPPSGPS